MKKLGFGFMRLPMIGADVDIEQTKKMVDRFMADGFSYFDTAHVYIDGKSEIAMREALVKRYPREAYRIADKLTWSTFESEEDIRRVFEEQLQACGVTYFDYYLIHAMSAGNREKYENCNAYGVAAELKKSGKIRHLGMSFHDQPEVLDSILTDHPETEFVQIQFNYLDYYSARIKSKERLGVCIKHGKPVIVMEPVKGGRLADLPGEAHDVFAALGGNMSDASYAVRFAATAENVFMVLSGMSTLEQVEDNTGFMKDFTPLNARELEACAAVRDICNRLDYGMCTGCRYCVPGCPAGIAIPDLMDAMNKKRRRGDEAAEVYNKAVTGAGSPHDCIECGACEEVCPQKLKIRTLLPEIAKAFGESK